MVLSVKAIYQDGQLRLLEPVDLHNGDTVDLTIVKAEETVSAGVIIERLRGAGLLMDIPTAADVQELTPEERLRIGQLFVADRPSESIIDEERDVSWTRP